MGALSVVLAVLAVLAATVLVVPLADRPRLPLLLPPLPYSADRATSWLEFKRSGA